MVLTLHILIKIDPIVSPVNIYVSNVIQTKKDVFIYLGIIMNIHMYV